MSLTFKNILVAVAPTDESQIASKYAVSMGQALKSHVAACSYALHPDFRGAGIALLPDNVIGQHLAKIEKEGHEAIDRFQAIAKKAKVECSSEVFRSSLDTALTAFAETARTYDITVLAQTARGLEHMGDLFTEAALFYSGRPIILVPSNYTGEFSTARVLIAWDGSQHAARAVAHAMPLLLLADKIEILVVGDKNKAAGTRITRLISNLERHGIDVDLICRDEHDDANTIAQEAWNASLLVMGGYGHSKAREMFFGGVTRFMLQQASIPVFMAH